MTEELSNTSAEISQSQVTLSLPLTPQSQYRRSHTLNRSPQLRHLEIEDPPAQHITPRDNIPELRRDDTLQPDKCDKFTSKFFAFLSGIIVKILSKVLKLSPPSSPK